MAEGIQIKNLPSTTTIKQGDTMTIVQDKQNKQLSLDVFVNESDLATLSVLENRCDEVKAKIEVDEYSAEITTSQSMSKIGSDDSGVDLHENVLDGAFESCVLKGKTKYRDIDTGEILEDFEEGRNLELITVRMPILSTVGKNLFNAYKHEFDTSSAQGLRVEILNSNSIRTCCTDTIAWRSAFVFYQLEPHTWYNIRCEASGNGVKQVDINIPEYGTSWNPNITGCTQSNNMLGKFLTDESGKVKISFQGSGSESISYDNTYTNIQIEKISDKNINATSYEPFKTSILSLPEEVVLRSLPDGTCDTLNVETGEYVQRIGHIPLSSTLQYWEQHGSSNDEYFVGIVWRTIPDSKSGTAAICNKLKSKQTTREDSCIYFSAKYPLITFHKDSLDTFDTQGFNAKIDSMNLEIQYELETPITTTIDVQGFPHAYKNGHIQLSSGSTEPSLTPTVTYKVPVSRVGQIASNTKSNLRQTIKLDQLEVLVYQSLINAEYENLLVQNSAESATSFTTLSTNDPKDELYYMLKHLIEEDQPVQNMLDKINLFYLYGLLSDEHYFDLLLGGEEDVY